MTFYIGVVDQGADAFGVWFPDLPGCMAMGDTMDQLFANAITAIRDWIEVEKPDLARPRGLDEIMRDAETVAIARTDGATFIQVPLLLDAGRSVRANISIDAGLLEAIDTAAERMKVTRSTFLASAAREKIARGA
jgi:predicted RNase H-like HicB family nuclease